MLTSFARREAIVGAVLLVTGVVYGLLTAALPNRSLPNTPGPAFFPWLIAGALILLSAALLIRSLRHDVPEPSEASSDPDSKRRLFTLIWFAGYLLAIPYAGFLPASVPFFAGMMWFYGERNRLMLALAAIIFPGSLFYLFRYGFQILLPAGAW